MRAGLVTRGRAGHAADRLDERARPARRAREDVAGSGSFGKSSSGSVRRWNLAEPEMTSTSCSRRAVLQRDLGLRERAGDVEQQAAGNHDRALGGDLGIEARRGCRGRCRWPGARRVPSSSLIRTPASVWIALRVEAARATIEELGEERFTGNGKLQDQLSSLGRGSRGCGDVDERVGLGSAERIAVTREPVDRAVDSCSRGGGHRRCASRLSQALHSHRELGIAVGPRCRRCGRRRGRWSDRGRRSRGRSRGGSGRSARARGTWRPCGRGRRRAGDRAPASCSGLTLELARRRRRRSCGDGAGVGRGWARCA